MSASPPPDDDASYIAELLDASDTPVSPPSVVTDDESHIHELLGAGQTTTRTASTPPNDLKQLNAMIREMLRQKHGMHPPLGVKPPVNSHEALRQALHMRQRSRRTKHAQNVFTDKKTKRASATESNATGKDAS